jgi:hypothetical protein
MPVFSIVQIPQTESLPRQENADDADSHFSVCHFSVFLPPLLLEEETEK